jgi:hypothetical protein
LVALHHFGDPAWQVPTYNQGIPIMTIVKHLRTWAIVLGAPSQP